MDISAGLQELADALTAAGVPAALDPRDVSLPGAWVQLLQIDHDILCGDLTLTVGVDLISPDTGTLDALDRLGPMLAIALDAVGPLSVIGSPTVARTIVLPDSATAYPSLRLTLAAIIPAGVPA